MAAGVKTGAGRRRAVCALATTVSPSAARADLEDRIWPVTDTAQQLALALRGLDAELHNYGLDAETIHFRLGALTSLADDLLERVETLELARSPKDSA